MTYFENRAFRDLATMKARELEETGTEEAEQIADELRKLIKKIYAYQAKVDNNEKPC